MSEDTHLPVSLCEVFVNLERHVCSTISWNHSQKLHVWLMLALKLLRTQLNHQMHFQCPLRIDLLKTTQMRNKGGRTKRPIIGGTLLNKRDDESEADSL